MSNLNYEAIRATRRIMTMNMDEMQMVHACDRMFDGGEFSDQVHDRQLFEEETRVIEHVASRFGLHSDTLRNELELADYEEEGRFLENIMAGGDE